MKRYFLDLFSGIGGFALGAYWAGLRFDGHYFSEVDDYAISVYRKRFPDAVPLGDIKGIRGADLPKGDWIIAGGFPCQDISVAGKGAGLAGARSGLWYEYARIIGELRPRFAIMENVGALAFRGLDSVLGSLAKIGYDAEWQDIRASDVGAPHRRERIWIVAYPNEDGKPAVAFNEGEISKQLADPRSFGLQRCIHENRKQAQLSAQPKGSGESRGHWHCLPKPYFCRGSDGIPHVMDRLKCLGNSIVPQIAMMIFRWIKRILDREAA